jgi:hypothetical protein
MNVRPRWALASSSLVVLCGALAFPGIAHGQAWVPAKGTGVVTVAYRNLFVRDHTTDTGRRFRAGDINMNIVLADVDFGLTKRWAVSFSLPVIYANYKGAAPHRDPGEEFSIDDGGYHGGIQDLRWGVRYNLVRVRPLVISPFVEVIIPSHDYPIYGHAQIGRNLKEFLIGANIGRDFDPWVPNSYFQTRIAHAFAENVKDATGHHDLNGNHDRTNFDTQFGYQLNGRLGFSGVVHIQKHWGGLHWVDCSPRPLRECFTDEEWHLHGQLFNSDAIDIGGGASYFLSDSTNVFATFLYTPWSRNSHPITRGFTFGMNWRFDTRPPLATPPSGSSDGRRP